MSIKLEKPDYIVIYVSDMERSTAFYRDVLGLPLRFSSPGWTEFETGPIRLALHRAGSQERAQFYPGRPPAGVAHLAFVVEDIQAAFAELTARGATFSQAPEKQVTGNLIAVLHDPDGLGITLQQRLTG
jgi:lactoylglutathione lyase